MFFGLAKGNIVGGFIGFIIGYIIEEALNGNLEVNNKSVFESEKIKYTPYQTYLLALISEVVKADGYISKEEVYYIKSYLLNQFGSVYSNLMLKTLKLNVDKNFDVAAVSLKIRELINQEQKKSLIHFLYGITIQNGAISTNEKILLENIAKKIGLSQSDYEDIVSGSKQNNKNTSTSSSSNTFGYNPYKVLNIEESATDLEVKKAYRQMVLKHHPDKSDVNDEVANEKFNQISEAYHIIKKRRNIK